MAMPIIRDEIHKTVIRLRLIRNELLERGMPETADTLAQAIQCLESTDKAYITELAKKKQLNSGQS
jgi:response regulator of citrate/malate metabolism